MALTAANLLAAGNVFGLESTLGEFQRQNSLIQQILVVDAKGFVVLDTRGELQETILEGFEGAWGDSRSQEVLDRLGIANVRAEAPIFVGDETWGLIRAEYSLAPVREFGAQATKTALMACGILQAVGLYLTWIVLKTFRASLRSLVKTVEKAANGSFAARTGLRPTGELGKLVVAVDTLLVRLENSDQASKEERSSLEERLLVRTQALDDMTKQLDEMRERVPAQ